jgi:hypothetical protein
MTWQTQRVQALSFDVSAYGGVAQPFRAMKLKLDPTTGAMSGTLTENGTSNVVD